MRCKGHMSHLQLSCGYYQHFSAERRLISYVLYCLPLDKIFLLTLLNSPLYGSVLEGKYHVLFGLIFFIEKEAGFPASKADYSNECSSLGDQRMASYLVLCRSSLAPGSNRR